MGALLHLPLGTQGCATNVRLSVAGSSSSLHLAERWERESDNVTLWKARCDSERATAARWEALFRMTSAGLVLGRERRSKTLERSEAFFFWA